MIFKHLIFYIVLVYICKKFIKSNLIKELILFPISMIYLTIIIIMGNFLKSFIYFSNTVITILFFIGILCYYFLMKSIDKSTSKIDIYIYIYYFKPY